jgi:hypothetical protein
VQQGGSSCVVAAAVVLFRNHVAEVDADTKS